MHFRFACLSLLFATAAMASAQPNTLPRRGFWGVVAAADPAGGLKVSRVVDEGTAGSLGIQVGDRIVSVDGRRLTSPPELVTLAHQTVAGKNVNLSVIRDGHTLTLKGLMKGRPYQTDPELQIAYGQVATQGRTVRVIVTKPNGDGPFPVVFLIGGIGAYSVDGDFGAIPYGNILGPIAHAGYVTVRVDKPGQGDSEGPEYAKLTFQEELDAYRQCLRYVKTLPYADPQRIAIYGHSMGGVFAPLVGEADPVKAIIANGTIFRPWNEYMLDNTRRQSELAGRAEDQIDQELKQLSEACTYIFSEGNSVARTASSHPSLAAFLKGNFGSGETYSGVGIPFFQQLAQVDMAEVWKGCKCDVAAIYAENDFLSARLDHEWLVAWVNKLRPGTAKLIVLPGTDHGFSKTTSMKDSFDHWGRGGQFNDNIVTTLLAYLKSELS